MTACGGGGKLRLSRSRGSRLVFQADGGSTIRVPGNENPAMGAVNQALSGTSTPRRVSLANFREISTTAMGMLFKPVRQFGLFLSFFLFALLFEPLFSLFSLIFLLLSLSFFLFGWICRVADPIDAPSCNGPDPDPGRDGSSLSSFPAPRQATPSTTTAKRVLVFLGPVFRKR